ncbi:MAG: class I SAM-dependent methyltransferase [Candidatus Erginobacter occultus]|nr:class I SAM-dependent methyltransferase [Candidatus Erginobacter occultus]
MMKVLDIGCGKKKYVSNNPEDTVIGMDHYSGDGVDVVHDLEVFPWPFAGGEFDLVIANHVLEHLPDLIATMEEIWRVGRDGSLVSVRVPYFSFPGSFQDPTHKRFFTRRTFDYFLPRVEFNYYSPARFELVSRRLVTFAKHPRLSAGFDALINLFPRFYERFFAYIFPAENLFVELKVTKTAR